MRAPVGGLFRHVLDLASEQTLRGHDVGIMADATSSDDLTAAKLDAIRPNLTLGVHLSAMSRKPGLGDLSAARILARLALSNDIDVLHGHGAKGGAYARLAGQWLKLRRHKSVVFYTPHGGSLHFDPKTAEGRIYLNLEKVLARVTDGLIFESQFAHDAFAARIGTAGRRVRIIPNGLRPSDFGTHRPSETAADFLFIGELRQLKGVDVMLNALAAVQSARPVTARFVGGGPDAGQFKSLASRLGLDTVTAFPGPQPALDAFPSGRCLVVPSRAESFPYIVLEAGAQAMPMIATSVGGIPEMAESTPLTLIDPDDVAALTREMERFLSSPMQFSSTAAAFTQKVETHYTVEAMTSAITGFYAETLG